MKDVFVSDQEADEYLVLALANGFSKGTANVSPRDMAKLRPLLKHYAKKPHPFRACVKDNRKRFGPGVNAICAVVKDLIYHSTKWRNKGNEKSMKKHFAEDDDFVAFAANVPDEFYTWLEQVGEEEILLMIDEIDAEEIGLSEDEHGVLAEIFFSDEDATEEDDGLVWKTVLREGLWKFSPGPDGPLRKPMQIVKSGKSNKEDLIVSMAELKRNFENGAVEHVTVPLSHEDAVQDNTGFVRKLRWGKTKDGKATLIAGIEFTEPDVKDKAIRGTIANTSGGIIFDHIAKESGKKFGSVLGHVALTNKPWLNGMQPFGATLSDEPVSILAFSEEVDSPSGRKEATHMPDEDSKTPEEIVAEELGLSVEDAKAKLELADQLTAENAELKKVQREKAVADQVEAWQGEGKSPAVLTIAEAALLADTDGDKVELLLSQDGKTKQEALSLSEIVTKLVEASPKLNLSEDQIKDEDISGDKPEGDETKEVELSADVKRVARQLFLHEGFSNEDAIKEAQARSKKAAEAA